MRKNIQYVVLGFSFVLLGIVVWWTVQFIQKPNLETVRHKYNIQEEVSKWKGQGESRNRIREIKEFSITTQKNSYLSYMKGMRIKDIVNNGSFKIIDESGKVLYEFDKAEKVMRLPLELKEGNYKLEVDFELDSAYIESVNQNANTESDESKFEISLYYF